MTLTHDDYSHCLNLKYVKGGIDILSRDERSKAEERARRFGLSLSENSPSIVDAAMELGGRHEVENERRLSRGKRFGIGDISWMARFFLGGGGERRPSG